MGTKINALVEVLSTYERDALSRLRTRFPDASLLLKDGAKMGAGDDTRAMMEVSIIGLKTVHARVSPNLRALQARLGRARRIRFLGGLVGAASSAGIAAAMLGQAHPALSVTAAVITFSSSVSVLYATHLESTNLGSDVVDLTKKLISISAETEVLLARLEIDVNNVNWSTERVQKANDLAIQLLEIERSLGTIAQ